MGKPPEDEGSNIKPELNIKFKPSNVALKYLTKYGFREGHGLGSTMVGPATALNFQQRIDPNAGLGFNKSGLEVVKHEYEEFSYEIRIKPEWCPDCPREPITLKEMKEWVKLEERMTTITKENITCEDFGSKEMQVKIIDSKAVFDDIQQSTFRRARDKANPFEMLKKEFFQNRAALKMCELDAIFGFIFTRPPCNKTYQNVKSKSKVKQEKPARRKHVTEIDNPYEDENITREPFFFADVCGGPGGFSEYLLHMHNWMARGFGITLGCNITCDEDWQLKHFHKAAPYDTFTVHYGKDKTGDITKTDNIKDFFKTVDNGTAHRGVDLVMADGGINASKDYKSQELLNLRVIFSEFIFGLGLLKKGGIFVIKMFDCFLPHTVALMYLLRTCFDKFAMCKPNQSRPANSERYLIYSGLKLEKRQQKELSEHLQYLNTVMEELQTSGTGRQ
eukprot:UN30389